MQSDEIFEHVLRETDVTLFPHQVSAIQWMQRTERRTRMVSEQPHGGILAHAMGLGKTITTLSLMLVEGIGCTIVVCPKSVINQWRDEAVRILKLAPEQVVLYHGSLREAELYRACQRGGPRVVLTTFDIVRLDTRAKPGTHDNAATKRVVKGVADPHDRGLQPFQPKASEFESRPDFDSPVLVASGNTSCGTSCGTSRVSLLHSEHWDRIILDEAHRICEQSSKTARAIRTLRARNRWCITGTPFKNGISDLVALSKFLLVPPYCNSTWWRCHSHNKHKISEWRNMFMNIQDKSVLALSSISYNVLVIPQTTAEEQITSHVNNMFNQHIQNDSSTSNKPITGTSSARNPSVSDMLSRDVAFYDKSAGDIVSCTTGKSKRKAGEIEPIPLCNRQEYELLKIMRLRQAANHSLLLTNTAGAMLYLLTTPQLSPGHPPSVCETKPGACETSRKSMCHGCGSRVDRVPLKRVREHDVRQVERSSFKSTLSSSAGESVSPPPSHASRDASKYSRKHRCSHVLCNSCSTDMIMCPVCIASTMYTVNKTTRNGSAVWRHSSKTLALYNYLTVVFQSDANAKVVLFSQWTTCLDLLAAMLQFMGIEYGRFDGRVNSIDERADIILKFKTTQKCQVLLTSLGAGGEGLNLTFANHVVLMEPYWNIAVEQQAIDRLHRIGQTRTTCVLRLYTKNSIEHWVQDIQMKKNKELKRLLSEDEVVVTGDGECRDSFQDVIMAPKPVQNCLDPRSRRDEDNSEEDSETVVQWSVHQSGPGDVVGLDGGRGNETPSFESDARARNKSLRIKNVNSGASAAVTQEAKSAAKFSDVVTASSRQTCAPRQDAHGRRQSAAGDTLRLGVGVPNVRVPLRACLNSKNRFKIDRPPPPATRQRGAVSAGVGIPQNVFSHHPGPPSLCQTTPVKTCFSVDGTANKCGHADEVDAAWTSHGRGIMTTSRREENNDGFTNLNDRRDDLLRDRSESARIGLNASPVVVCGTKPMHGLSKFLLGS